jgi:ubiquinone/menaquinone biosynthesis C-methylase UbiE
MYNYKKYNERKYKEDYWVINRSQNKWFSNYVKLKIFKKWAARVKNKQIFLDIGGGVGNWAFHFLKTFKQVAVLDISKEALKKIPEKDIIKIQSSITRMKVKDNYADCIFLADVLEHIHEKDLNKAFSEISRITKKEGKIIAFTSEYGFGLPILIARILGKTTGRLMNGEINEGHVNRMRFSELNKLCENNGLKIINYYHYGILFQPITDFIKDRLAVVLQGHNNKEVRAGQEIKNKLKVSENLFLKIVFGCLSFLSYLDILIFGKVIPGSSVFLEIKKSE